MWTLLFSSIFFSNFKVPPPPPPSPSQGLCCFLNVGLTQTCIATAVPPTWEPYQSSKRVTRKCKIIVRNKVFETQVGGGGGGYSHFFFICRLGPSFYRSPQNKYQEFQAPQIIFEILATPKISPILYLKLTLRKYLKMHRNDS